MSANSVSPPSSRHDMGVEHRQRAGHGAERGVGVPQAIGQPVEPALAVGLEDLAVAVEVGDVGDLGAVEAMLDAGMPRLLGRRMDRAEMAGEIDLLLVGELLVAKDHDRVAVDRVLDGVAVGGLQRLREVDAGNLGDELRLGRLDGDAHNRLLRL